MACALLSVTSAQAAAIWGTGNAGMDENVLFGHSTCAGCVDGPATMIVGHGQNSDILVDFTSLASLVTSGANTITYDPANSTPGFTLLSINVPGYLITGIMFQLTEISAVTDGSVTLTANLSGGAPAVTGTFTLPHQGGGLNQFNFTGGTAVSIDIASTLALHDISQVSISLEAVPEPTTFGMVGAGLVALAFLRRRRS